MRPLDQSLGPRSPEMEIWALQSDIYLVPVLLVNCENLSKSVKLLQTSTVMCSLWGNMDINIYINIYLHFGHCHFQGCTVEA